MNFFWSTVALHFPGATVVKNPPGTAGDTGSVPGLGGCPGEGKATHSNILAWRIPWTEEPGRLQFMGSQRVGHNLATEEQHQNVSKKTEVALYITL